jgi:hypothetical protein
MRRPRKRITKTQQVLTLARAEGVIRARISRDETSRPSTSSGFMLVVCCSTPAAASTRWPAVS